MQLLSPSLITVHAECLRAHYRVVHDRLRFCCTEQNGNGAPTRGTSFRDSQCCHVAPNMTPGSRLDDGASVVVGESVSMIRASFGVVHRRFVPERHCGESHHTALCVHHTKPGLPELVSTRGETVHGMM